MTDGQRHKAGTSPVAVAVEANAEAAFSFLRIWCRRSSCKSTGSCMHACACMHVRMSVCGKYEGMYVRRHACTCVCTTPTPTPPHRNILAVGCEAIHGLGHDLVLFSFLVLSFTLRAITHTHTSTHTKAIYAYIHLSIIEVPVACAAHLARLASLMPVHGSLHSTPTPWRALRT